MKRTQKGIKLFKRIALFCFALIFVLNILVGCTEKESPPLEYKIVYPKVKMSKLEYTLDDGDIAAFNEKLSECESIFESGDPERSEELKRALYEMRSLYAFVDAQADIAALLYDYDYSDKTMNKNMLYAKEVSTKMFGDAMHLMDRRNEEDNPLATVLGEFEDVAFVERTITRYGDATTPYNTFMNIRHQYNNLDDDVELDQVCKLYNDYLDALNQYAAAYKNSNYYEFSNEKKYFRDYDRRDRQEIRGYVKEYLVPLLYETDRIYDDLDVSSSAYSESTSLLKTNYDELSENYLFEYIRSLPADISKVMMRPFKNDLLLVGDKPNSKSLAHMGFIGDTPYVYLNEDDMDLTTVAHELGHFYADSMCPDTSSFDLSEVHSEANVLLMIKYLEGKVDEEAYKDFYMYSVHNVLYQAVSCALKDNFEEIVLLRAKNGYLSVEELEKIMSDLIDEYGVRDMSGRFVEQLMTYWSRLGFNDVGYQLSYTVSTVVTLQIYIKSFENTEASYEAFRNVCVNVDEELEFVNTVKNAGLYSPTEEKAYLELQKLLDYYGK